MALFRTDTGTTRKPKFDFKTMPPAEPEATPEETAAETPPKYPPVKVKNQGQPIGVPPLLFGKETMLPLDKLTPSPKNNFRPVEPEVFEELKNSIRSNGLVYPVIVRPTSMIEGYTLDGEYEILSGCNRVRACRELGLRSIKALVCLIKDVEAIEVINDTNLQRGDVTEREKAWAYRMLFDAMNRKGNNQYTEDELDIDGEDESVENQLCAESAQSSNEAANPHETGDSGPSRPEISANRIVPNRWNKRTSEIIAEMYGVSARTVSVKIRLTYLTDELYRLYERREMSQRTAADLSYLDERDQRRLLELRRKYHFAFDQERCEALRKDYNAWRREGKERFYADQRILHFLVPEQPKAKVRKPKRYVVPEELFPEKLKKKDRADYVEKALRYVLDNGIVFD